MARVTAEVHDVVVVGAGPAGSATAIGLARAGHRVTLIDRARFPRDKPCSEYMSPETVRHLDALGVMPDLDRQGGTNLEGTAVSGPLGSRLTGQFVRAGGTPFRPTGLALPRRVLDAVLVDAAARCGVEILEDTTVTELVREGNAIAGVVLRGRQGTTRTMTARLVVGADGLGSVVARRAGLHRRGRIGRIAFVAHVRGVRGLAAIAELHVAHDGYVGLNPLGNDIANVALVVPAHIAASAKGNAEAFMRSRLELFPGVRGRVDMDRVVRHVMVTGPFDVMARRSTTDGALLVGDAADFFDPFTGEGICAALRGAELAAHATAKALERPGPITARHLRPYRSARRRAFLGKWVIERVIGYGMLAPALFDRAVARIERRGLADTLIGVTGQFVSPWVVLNPMFVTRMVV